MARAINSLPVPVSPRISTVESVGATCSTCVSTDSRAGLSPMIPSNLHLEEHAFRSLDRTLLTSSMTDTPTFVGAIKPCPDVTPFSNEGLRILCLCLYRVAWAARPWEVYPFSRCFLPKKHRTHVTAAASAQLPNLDS